jgi:transposase
MRQRASLIKNASIHINHMQKALSQMNIHLSAVLSDILGATGLKIIRAIVEKGERNPKILATLRHKQCKNSEEVIEKSLTGSYREEHLFALKQALELYDIYKQKKTECDQSIEKELLKYTPKSAKIKTDIKKKKSNSNCKNKLSFDATKFIVNICGVDLTKVPGLEATSAMCILSEIGNDITKWKTAKHFASWLCLCPGNKVSGGKILSGRTIKSSNIAAQTLRLAAQTLHGSKSALGAFYRRMRTRLGAPKAITAAAHELAVIIYNMIRNQTEYEDLGQNYYENKYRTRVLNTLSRRAKELGFDLVKSEPTTTT